MTPLCKVEMNDVKWEKKRLFIIEKLHGKHLASRSSRRETETGSQRKAMLMAMNINAELHSFIVRV